jgi:acetyl esterase/lipase
MKFAVLLMLVIAPLHAQQKVAIWPQDKAPVKEGEFESKRVFITVHKAKSDGPVAAVVICPGGGYGGLVTGGEGHGIAAWLNTHGITGVVLEYRLPKGRHEVPLLDAQRALRLVRHKAAEWNIRPQQIGIIGFSAGGHLASSAITQFDPGDKDSTDEVERVSCRPDFGILVYPVVSMGDKTHNGSKNRLLGRTPSQELMDRFSAEKQVTAQTPPVFLAHALDDRVVVPENSKMLYDALQAKKIKAKYLELASGGHGLNGYKGPMWDAWQTQSIEWLLAERIITSPK